MSFKVLIFNLISLFTGFITIINNLKNPWIIISVGTMMICCFMIFQATLNKDTNLLSKFMLS